MSHLNAIRWDIRKYLNNDFLLYDEIVHKVFPKVAMGTEDTRLIENYLSFRLQDTRPNKHEQRITEDDKEKKRLKMDTLGMVKMMHNEIARRLARILKDQYLNSFAKLCIETDYCNKMKSGQLKSDKLDLAVAIADGLASSKLGFPLPVALISSYVVKNELLPYFCNC